MTVSRDALKAAVVEEVDRRADQHVDIARQIHARPELGHEEHFAHELLTSVLEGAGLAVQRKAYGLDTAFAARPSTSVPRASATPASKRPAGTSPCSSRTWCGTTSRI